MTCLLCRFDVPTDGLPLCAACRAELETPIVMTVDGLAHQAKRLIEKRLEVVNAELKRLNVKARLAEFSPPTNPPQTSEPAVSERTAAASAGAHQTESQEAA